MLTSLSIKPLAAFSCKKMSKTGNKEGVGPIEILLKLRNKKMFFLARQ